MATEGSSEFTPPTRHYTLLAGRIYASQSTESGEARIDDDVLYSNLVTSLRETKGVQEPARDNREPHIWVFGNLVELNRGTDRFIFGRLGKLRPTHDQGVFDWDTHAFTSRSVDAQTWTGYSNFIVDIVSRTILFEERPPIISERQFCLYFKRLYEAHTHGFYRIDINRISATADIFSFAEDLDKVTAVTAELWPANPHVDREFEALQAQIVAARATRLKIRLENQETGLSTEGTLASQSIALATKGYGEVTIEGTKGGQTLSIRSSERVVKELVDRLPDIPAKLANVFVDRIQDLREKLGRK
jgi:hypothetical protein